MPTHLLDYCCGHFFDCEHFATYTVSQNETRPRGRRVARASLSRTASLYMCDGRVSML